MNLLKYWEQELSRGWKDTVNILNLLVPQKMITTTQKGDQDIPKLLLNEVKGDLGIKKGDQNTFQHALTKSSKISNHGWPSTQAEVKTEAEAHLAEVSLAES